MLENGSLRNCCDPGGRGRLGLAEREEAAAGAPRPAWVVPVLSSVLIFTTVVDILGNLLVILSVFKNRKLRNSAGIYSPGDLNHCVEDVIGNYTHLIKSVTTCSLPLGVNSTPTPIEIYYEYQYLQICSRF
ncbi:hypothetical protein WISP_01918 [Willisornis vidua]|uniref:Uncharacterized protein n=1 Tax=Willisornis vidua TaxID=1566151 RepID=A0ABQ9DYV3_9PASS|nr:hypothetical protein WISP_01918 [Willisornis vidua]